MRYIENKKIQIAKNVKALVKIRILGGTMDLRKFPYERNPYGVPTKEFLDIAFIST